MNDRRKRSWLSIRLRTLLLLTLASGCILGLIGRESRQAKRREEAAQELARATSKIEIEYCSFWGQKVETPPPEWQRRLLGEHYFQRVTAIVISNPSDLPDDGRLIGELRDLKTLGLRGSNWCFTDQHARALSRLRKLEDLGLVGAKITDEAVLCLSHENPLRSLDLQHTLITDAGLEHIAQFKTLEWLNLSETLVTDEGIGNLAELPRLKCVHLRRVMVSDEGVHALTQCKNLEMLTLGELPLSADLLAEVAQLPRLQELRLADGAVVFQKLSLEDLRTRPSTQEQAVRLNGPPNVFWAIDRSHCPRNTPYLKWLLEHGADPNAAKSGLAAAAVLAGRDAIEPVAVLLDYRANLNPDRRSSWRTPLALAAQREHLDMMRFLLSRGADPNRVNGQGYAPLHEAAAAGNLEIIKLLLGHGADRSLKNHRGETAYAIARQGLSAENPNGAAVLELLKPESVPEAAFSSQ